MSISERFRSLLGPSERGIFQCGKCDFGVTLTGTPEEVAKQAQAAATHRCGGKGGEAGPVPAKR